MFALQRSSPFAALPSVQLMQPLRTPSPTEPSMDSQLLNDDQMAYDKLLFAGLENLLNPPPDLEKLALQLLTLPNTQPALAELLFSGFNRNTPKIQSTNANTVTNAQFNAQLAAFAAMQNQINNQLLTSVAATVATTTTSSPTKTVRRRPQPLKLPQSNFQPKETNETLSAQPTSAKISQASPLDLSVKSASSTASSTSRFSLEFLIANGRGSPNAGINGFSIATSPISPIDLSTPSVAQQSLSPRQTNLCKKKKLIASLTLNKLSSNVSTNSTPSSTASTILGLQHPPQKKLKSSLYTADNLSISAASSASTTSLSTTTSASSSKSASPALPIEASLPPLPINFQETILANTVTVENIVSKINTSFATTATTTTAKTTASTKPICGRPNKRKLDSLENESSALNKTIPSASKESLPSKRPRAKARSLGTIQTTCHPLTNLQYTLPNGIQSGGAVILGAEQIFNCNECGAAFAHADRLQKHCKSKHGTSANGGNGGSGQASSDGSSPGSPNGKTYVCDECHRSFARSDMLTRHGRLHTGHKPYTCETCAQVFSRSDHLATHKRTHSGEKPYKCFYCSYTACRRDMITRHMKTHDRQGSGSAIDTCNR